jgi:hypothetical protein
MRRTALLGLLLLGSTVALNVSAAGVSAGGHAGAAAGPAHTAAAGRGTPGESRTTPLLGPGAHLSSVPVRSVSREVIAGHPAHVATLAIGPLSQAERNYLLARDYERVREQHADVWCPRRNGAIDRHCFRVPRAEDDEDQ